MSNQGGNNLADIALKAALINKENVINYSFLKEVLMKGSIALQE